MNRDSGRGQSYVANGESDYADFDNFSDQQNEVPSTKQDYTYILGITGYTTATPPRTRIPDSRNDILTEKQIKRQRTIILALAALVVLLSVISIVFIALFAVAYNKNANTVTQPLCEATTNPSKSEATGSLAPQQTTVCETVTPVICPVCPCYSTSPLTTFTDNPRANSTIRPNTVTTTKVPGGKFNGSYDLVFVIDQSETSLGGGQYGPQNFQLIKNALKDVASRSYMTIAPDVNRMAWIAFSSSTPVSNTYLLSSSESNYDTIAAIDKLVYYAGGSNAAYAFGYTYNTLLNVGNGARKDPTKVRELVILISDGNYKHWDYASGAASSIAVEIRNSNTSIYAIAVAGRGNSIDEPNLLAITGNPDHTYKISDYTVLTETIKSIIQSQTFTPPICTSCLADFILIVDRSQSIGADYFEALRKFFIYFTGHFPVDGDNQNRFALVTYSDSADVKFLLNRFTSNYALAGAINNQNSLIYNEQGGGTNTAGALQEVVDQVLKPPAYKPINGSSTIVVLFTDGMHDVGDDPTLTAAKLRTTANATIVSVGIGPLVNKDELIGISGSKDLVYMLDDFIHQAVQFVEFVSNVSCSPIHN